MPVLWRAHFAYPLKMVFHFPGKRKILSTNLYDSHLQRRGNQTPKKKALQHTTSVVTNHYTVHGISADVFVIDPHNAVRLLSSPSTIR